MNQLVITALALTMALGACKNNNHKPDAFGNFEVDDVTVSAQSQGTVLNVYTDRGNTVKAGDILAEIDSSAIVLQKAQLEAQKLAVQSSTDQAAAQISVINQQITNLNRDITRFGKMLKDGAATQKQVDDVAGQLDVLKKQKLSAESQRKSVSAQVSAISAQINVLNDQIGKCTIKAPIDGVVLEKYLEKGELASPGKPLFKVAPVGKMYLKIYISETQLAGIKLGQTVWVMADNGADLKKFDGVISWISTEAEFTPKIIQTREERKNLVYAVRVAVINDGSLKIGMPGEVTFN